MAYTEPQRYHVYLDYKGFMIDEQTYRVFPAPLMGSKFNTGTAGYQQLDFWQIGAMADFSLGINQKFMINPSQFYYTEGIDISKPGEFKLERDLETQSFPTGVGKVTARYRAMDALWLGTSHGKILKTTDGTTFSEDKDTGSGQIYTFYEYGDELYVTKGSENSWVKQEGTWYELTEYTNHTAAFENNSTKVVGANTNWNVSHEGRSIKNNNDGNWYQISKVVTPTEITLSQVYTGSTTDQEAFTIEGVNNLYYVMAESDYLYGMFNDGVRQSKTGKTWIPRPPDPLWELPGSEGTARNAIGIPRGFLIGAKRGVWIFLGGGSAVNLWMFPERASLNNFRGMDKFKGYALFSIEGEGLFYTTGSDIYPTEMHHDKEPFQFSSCKSILNVGWEMFALVSDGTYWYLARSSMKELKTPKHWWIVKKLTKRPQFLSAFSDTKIFIHYENGTCEKYNKVSGPYQSSGYIETSLVDERLILLQKYYRALTLLFSDFPANTTAKLAYRLKLDGSYTTKSFSGDNVLSKDFRLENPTLGNRIQIKSTLETSDTSKSPTVTDLCWKYILERPTEEVVKKKNWHFRVIAEDDLEKVEEGETEMGLNQPRSRADVTNNLWDIGNKQEILNFVGADNELHEALNVKYTGSGASCICTIDKTNHKWSTEVDGLSDQEINYENHDLRWLRDQIQALSNYEADLIKGVPQNQSAEDLFPVKNLQLKGGAKMYYGTDVHAVIIATGAPGQYKMAIQGRGSDRVNISLREV